MRSKRKILIYTSYKRRFFLFKKNYESLALGKNHGDIEEDEFLIFEINIKEDNIELINYSDKNIFKHI
jgi:hypothetical protein